MIQDVLSRFNKQNTGGRKSNECKQGDNGLPITPQQLLVVAGILGGALEVNSVLVGRDQNIEILLVGSLKRQTQLDKILDQIGSLPFDEVVKSIIGRLV
jgi:hypothetical protein